MTKITRILLIALQILLTSSCTTESLYYDSDQVESFSNFHILDGSVDIPLAEGLEVKHNSNFNYDSFNGNIVSISYKTKIDLIKIKDFYVKTLPQMGWHLITDEETYDSEVVDFQRDGETLEIEFAETEEGKVINFYAKLEVQKMATLAESY